MSGVTSAPVTLWRRLLAELLGSAFLAAVVIGSGIAAQRLSPGETGLELLENAAATAAGLFAIILMFGPVSGGHFNPVVSFVDAAFGGLSLARRRRLSAGAGGRLHRRRGDREPDVRPARGQHLRQAPGHPAHFLSEVIATLGLIAGDLRPGPVGPVPGRPGGGGRLYRRGVLLHLLHQLRQPGDHHRPDVLRHLRRASPRPRHSAFIAAQILGGAAGHGGHQGAVSGHHPGPGRRHHRPPPARPGRTRGRPGRPRRRRPGRRPPGHSQPTTEPAPNGSLPCTW